MNQEAQPRKQQELQVSMEETTSEPNQPMTATASASASAATEETSEPSAATEETTLDPRLTSFLEKDDSFLTPWSWDPNNASQNEASSQPLHFQPGSFFESQIFDGKSGSNPQVNNQSQAESSNVSRTRCSQPREPLNAFPPMSSWKIRCSCSHESCPFRQHQHD